MKQVPVRVQRVTKEVRREAIAERVLEEQSVFAATLAEQFDVSLITIHRDLDELAAQGVLRRFHGGAAALRSALFEPDLTYRVRLATHAKYEVGSAALEFVAPESSVLLDDSTTTLVLAKLLLGRGPLTVLTSFLEAQKELVTDSEIRLIGLGGDYWPAQHSFGGAGYLEALKHVRADVMVASTSALDADGLYHQDSDVVVGKQAMLTVAKRRILLADHTKLGQRALHRIGGLDQWDAIVVDSKAAPERVQELRDGGGNIVVAKALAPRVL